MPREIVVHPFARISDGLLVSVKRAIEENFPGTRARTGETLSIPKRAYVKARDQYVAQLLLNSVAESPSSGPEVQEEEEPLARIGVTDVDLFAHRLNFVFGMASESPPVCVISVARLDPVYYGEPHDRGVMIDRALKEAVHELGHVFGLSHCDKRACVMWFSNTLDETDRKESVFCESHRRELYGKVGRKTRAA